jgi:hypothetical protein
MVNEIPCGRRVSFVRLVPLVRVYAVLLPRLSELTHPSVMTRPAHRLIKCGKYHKSCELIFMMDTYLGSAFYFERK